MARDSRSDAALALHRFGFGARAGSIAAIASDPRGALLADLERPQAGQLGGSDLRSSGEAARATFDFRRERIAARSAERAQRDAERQAPPKNALNGDNNTMTPSHDDAMASAETMAKPRAPAPGVPQQIYLDEAKARHTAALDAEIGFAERLVWFWSNHFCVSADKAPMMRALAGPFEREAIRAHVLGRFGDMLLAVEQHPAMLIYLDNARSIGPDSIAGRRRGKGLNENLAREILELHTLGVRTVYSQADVTNFAKVITGWSIVPFRQDPERGGEFNFNPRMHEPGAQTVIGKSYAEGGVEQGRAVLADVARHPATAHHIATKIAAHFVADVPPPALVEKLARRFLDTQGNLKELSKALVTAPEAWDAPRAKLKRPGEWLIATMRATGMQMADGRKFIQSLVLLGEPLWRPSAPKGFSDASDAWVDGLAQRLDIANQLSRQLGDRVDVRDVAEQGLGPLLSDDTRQTLARAASRPQALALLLMAPEFQRR